MTISSIWRYTKKNYMTISSIWNTLFSFYKLNSIFITKGVFCGIKFKYILFKLLRQWMCFYTCKRFIGLLNIIFHSFQKEHSYYTTEVFRWIIFRPSIQVSCLINRLKKAGSLNQGAATASSERILKAAYYIEIF